MNQDRVNDAAVSSVRECSYCHAEICFSGYIRSPKGVMFVLDYPKQTIHNCPGQYAKYGIQEPDSQEIRYMQTIVDILSKGLQTKTVRLVIEEKPQQAKRTIYKAPDKIEDAHLTNIQKMLLASRK